MTSVITRVATPFADAEARIDGRAKVTGAARFLADRVPADTLWLAIARSPFPHARIVSVDTEAAAAMPGVVAVITGADIPGVRFGRRLQDWPLLAWDRVRFIGDRVAAVAAETPQEAAAAAAAIDVEYEELPAILSIKDAIAADAPILHPDAASYTYIGPQRPPVPHPNAQGHTRRVKGDPKAALAGAHRVFEHRFTTSRQHQGHLEPHGASAWVGSDGVLHVLTTNKSPFSLRGQLARSFGIAETAIEVDSGSIGGDFGGKGLSLNDGLCIALARRTGRPVSSVMSYADELQAANPRHAAVITLRSGVDRSGRIVAHWADFRFDGGAYAAGKPMPELTPPGPLATLAAYDIPAIGVEATVYYTNTVPAGHMRSPGEVQANFATESHLDMIATDLGIDPIAYRRMHAAGPGTTDVAGRTIREPRAAALLDRIQADRANRRAMRDRADGADAPDTADSPDASPDAAPDTSVEGGRWRHGRGVSLTARHMEGGRMTIRLRAHADGSVDIRTGIPDQGAGAHTMMLRVAAETTGLPIEAFRIVRETTATATADLGVGASRVTFVGSRATAAAAERLRDEVLARASAHFGNPVVGLVNGRFTAPNGAIVGSYEAVAAGWGADPLEVEGTFDSEAHHDDPQDFNVAAYDIEVAVDERTGVVRIVDAFLAADVGTIINPVSHQGQVDGGFAFGVGAALLEELAFDDGRVTTVHLGDYKLPTIMDVPHLRTGYLHAEGRGAFGAKMAGELSVSGVAPAVANAVAAAVGARVTHLPLSPERVLAALATDDGTEAE